jgi:phage tail protein X
MRSNRLIAHDGDALDGLIWREAALGPEALPAVFSDNPGLCEQLTLRAGQVVTLPEAVFAQSTRVEPTLVALWD